MQKLSIKEQLQLVRHRCPDMWEIIKDDCPSDWGLPELPCRDGDYTGECSECWDKVLEDDK